MCVLHTGINIQRDNKVTLARFMFLHFAFIGFRIKLFIFSQLKMFTILRRDKIGSEQRIEIYKKKKPRKKCM